MESENLCRSPYDTNEFDFVSMGDPGCTNDPAESKWIAYEGSLPEDSDFSGSIPRGWCVLENYAYKEQYRLLKTNNGNNMWVLIPPPRRRGNPEGTYFYFKAIPHGKGQVTILNAAANKILEMKLHKGIWKVRANIPRNSICTKCLFTIEEVDDGPGKVASISDIST